MRRLTGADVYVENQLFATLDTTTRRMNSARIGANGNGLSVRDESILLIDTVGFIRKLPHHLVTSFRATLEDIAQADLYLHVVDASHPAFEEHMAVTNNAVADIDNPNVDTVYLFNKTDMLADNEIEGLKARYPDGVFISARENTGFDQLRGVVEDFFFATNIKVEVKISAGDGRTIARARNLLREPRASFEDDICVLHGTIETDQMGRLESVPGVEIRYLL
jgi:GTP-binding protein HflX